MGVEHILDRSNALKLRTLGKCRFGRTGGFVKSKISQRGRGPLKPLSVWRPGSCFCMSHISLTLKNKSGPVLNFTSAWYGTNVLKAYTTNINLFHIVKIIIGAPFSALAPGAETPSYATA